MNKIKAVSVVAMLFYLIPSIGLAGPEFIQHTIIGKDMAFTCPQAACSADFDNDGDIDIIAVGRMEERIICFVNDGDGIMSIRVLSDVIRGARSLDAGDMDNDGDMDFAICNSDKNMVMWFENQGDLEFIDHNIQSYGRVWECLKIVDVNQDQINDILTAANDRIALFIGDQDQHYTAQTVISDTYYQEMYSADAVDMDGDGDIDILYSCTYLDKIGWCENDGEENFTNHTITTSAELVYDVTAADYDNDGDIDIAAGTQTATVWYENLDGQNFAQHTIKTFDGEDIWIKRVFKADLNGDGSPDLFSGDDHSLFWYENNGSGDFTPHCITTLVNYLTCLNIADYDNDGIQDILTTSEGDQKIVWYKNDGNKNFNATILLNHQVGIYAVCAMDPDHDGDTDIIYTGSEQSMTVLVNDGNENFDKKYITYGQHCGAYVWDVDLDNDGDTDFLTEFYDGEHFAWYENRGNLEFSAHILPPKWYYIYIVKTGDLDSDGDIDIIPASFEDDYINWYENDGYGNFSVHAVDTNIKGPVEIAMIDVEGDHDMDLLVSLLDTDDLICYKNDGQQNFTPYTLIEKNGGLNYIKVFDPDKDGDMDFLTDANSLINGYENDGTGHFTYHNLGYTGGYGQMSIQDLDMDNDLDMITSNGLSLYLHQNNGNWNYEPDTLITELENVRATCIADVDGDSDMDIIAATVGQGTVTWFENTLVHTGITNQDEQPAGYELVGNYPNPFNPETRIRFTLPATVHVALHVYNLQGQLVDTIYNQLTTAGAHTITWNGSGMPSGAYFIQMTAGTYRQVQKCLLLK